MAAPLLSAKRLLPVPSRACRVDLALALDSHMSS